MVKLTRREAALAWNSQAPIGAEVPVPEKRKADPNSPKEWRLQCECVKILRQWQTVRKDLRFIAPQAENPRDAKRAAMAKAMGMQRGVPDLWIFLPYPFRAMIVELKLEGRGLSPEQREWFDWFGAAEVPCHRITSAAEFARVLEEFLR